jgi:prepilin-type N-terminal cleavage/methylation domain-containing protein/prepilin-type processing-associated H-X9-DG protein
MGQTPNLTQARPSGFTLIEVIVVVSIIGILAALTIPAVQMSREAAARSACSNNLRQIGLGLQGHQSAHGTFPPQSPAPNGSEGSTYSYEGITWHVYVLPFIEQNELWSNVRTAYEASASPWGEPHRTNLRVVVSAYMCPSDGRLGMPLRDRMGNLGAYTSYVGMTGYTERPTSGVFGRRQGIHPGRITDGLSSTIMVGERPPPESLSMGWWYTTHRFTNLMAATDGEVPADTGFSPGDPLCGGNVTSWPGGGPPPAFAFGPGSIDNECDKYHYWSLHPGGANFLFCDGSVRFVKHSARFQLRSLATIDGREIVPDLP